MGTILKYMIDNWPVMAIIIILLYLAIVITWKGAKYHHEIKTLNTTVGSNTTRLEKISVMMTKIGSHLANQKSNNFTIEDFIIIDTIIVQDETCTGMGNGSITIVATSSANQLSYSVDGGVNWNLTGVFINLTPGNYQVEIIAQGTMGCSISGGTVTVMAGGSAQTWYKDFDSDTYSDGVTMLSCSQPSSYYLPADLNGLTNDCDDYDDRVT